MSRISGPPSLLINYILIFIILLPYTFVYAMDSQPLSLIVSRICINFITLDNYSLAFPYFIYLLLHFVFVKLCIKM